MKVYPQPEGEEVRKKILDFLKQNVRQSANVSYREILEEVGIASTSTVDYHLKRLEKEGKIRRNGQRSIEVLE